jgi:hypothetical protein
MGLFDKLKEHLAPNTATAPSAPRRPAGSANAGRNPDEVAIERYKYMLRTAPPETIEQAHAEAFAKLTPEQRQQVLAEMSTAVPEAERAQSADPRDLARMATRAEMRQPGMMERTLGGHRGPGMGSMIAGSLLGSVAGAFIAPPSPTPFLPTTSVELRNSPAERSSPPPSQVRRTLVATSAATWSSDSPIR